jgi:hypothetical protein
MITKNILYQYFKDFADNHLQIKDYGYGDLWEISSSQATQYPLFWVSPQPSSISGNEISYNFNILIGDRVEDGDGNKVEVESDTFQIGLDLLATLNLHTELDLEKSNTLTPFIHDFKDRIAGHLITLSVMAPFNYNECAVPTTGTPQPPASSCPSAFITINGVDYGSVISGGTEDIAVVDGSGTPVGSLVSGNWVVVASCPNASAVLKNTLGTTLSTTSILSGGSSDITAPDSTITINSATFLNYPSGATSNILVKDGSGTQVGSKVGSEWIVPSSSYTLGLTDRFGNAFPTKTISSNATWDLRTLTPYDWADLFLSKETSWGVSGVYTDAQARTAITNLVASLFSAGLWTKLHFFLPFVGGTAQKHSYNLIYPFLNRTSFNANFVGSPTHGALGMSGNGSNGLFIAHSPNSIKSGYEFHYGIYSQGGDRTTGFTADMGFNVASNSGFHVSTAYNSNLNHRVGIFSFQATTYTGTDAGYWIGNRLGSSFRSMRNGTDLINTTTTADGSLSAPITITSTLGGIGGTGGVISNGPSRTYSTYHIGDGLTTQNLTDLNTIVQAYNTALFRPQ